MRKMPLFGLLATFSMASIASANDTLSLILSDDQLDAAVAGSSVASGAHARASGPETFVSTEADTTAGATQAGEFAAGLGVAAAFGNGSGATATADTAVQTNGSGPAYNRDYTVYYENLYGAYTVSTAVGATR